MDLLPPEILTLIFSLVQPTYWFGLLCSCRKCNSVGQVVFDPSINKNMAIQQVCQNGNVTAVKYLLKDKRVDASTMNNFPVRIASKNGHSNVVKELLKDKNVDPSAVDN